MNQLAFYKNTNFVSVIQNYLKTIHYFKILISTILANFNHVCLHISTRTAFIFIANLLLNLHNVSIFLCPTSFILHIFYMNNSRKNIQSVNRKKKRLKTPGKKRIVAS